MADQANPFEAFQAMMLQNLDKVQSATQSYIDTVEKAMLGFPGAKEDQVADFKASRAESCRKPGFRGKPFAREGFPGSHPH